jgi:hypothetical protein
MNRYKEGCGGNSITWLHITKGGLEIEESQ